MDMRQMSAGQSGAWRQASVSEIAEAIEHVGEACSALSMTREALLEYRRRFQALGLEGLRDLPPPSVKSQYQAPATEIIARIADLSLDRPDCSARQLNSQLKLEGIWMTTPTVQGILDMHGMGTTHERLLKLEVKHLQEHRELTPEQVRLIEKANPCFAERHIEATRPGMLLAQDVFYIGRLDTVGKVYVDVVVDTYSSYAFGFLHPARLPEAAAAILHNSVLPFFRSRDLAVEAIITRSGREYCGSDTHIYELYLALNDIGHRRVKNREPYVNGFLEAFRRALLDEFARGIFVDKGNASIDELQSSLNLWITHHNLERPHPGYRNLGRCPIESIEDYIVAGRAGGANTGGRDAASATAC
jgi:transposase InsO family protein